jgi:LacI family transcriptional regulator
MCVRTHKYFEIDNHLLRFALINTEPMYKNKKVTLQDVARYANVSVGTIDRVLHKRGKVSPEKLRVVEEAISKLNFNPNQLARTLALGNQFSICILMPSAPSSGDYWSMPLQGMRTASAQFKDYGIATDFFFYDLFDETSFIEQANRITNLEPDGVVLAPLFLKEGKAFINRLNEKGIPYIFIDADIKGEHCLSYIGPDLKRSGYIAAKLLHSVLPENGEILIVNMVKGIENASAQRRIEAGFRYYFIKNGLKKKHPIHSLTIKSTGKEAINSELTRHYIRHPAIEGVFATNSKAFLISEFHRVHDLDIRLVGFDLVKENIEHLKNGRIDYIISQSAVQQGKQAIRTLFDYFVYKKSPDKVQYVPLDIIIRENLDFYLSFNGWK